MNRWQLIRSGLAISLLLILIRLTIVDYPWGMNIWDAWIQDKAGFWHEVVYVSTFFLVLIDLSYYWQKRERERVYILRTRRGE